MSRARKPRETRPPHRPPASAEAAAPVTDQRIPLALGLAVLFLAYLALYFFNGPQAEARRALLVTFLLPDELVRHWLTAQPAILDRFAVWLPAAALVLFALAPGSLLLRALGLAEKLNRLEHLALALGCGLSLMSLATLVIGLCSGLRHPLAFTIPAAIVLTLAARGWRNRYLARLAPEQEPKPRGAATSGQAVFVVIGLVLLGLLLLLAAALPPVDFDVREYHLQAPKEWFQQGRISFLAHNIYANMPLGAEMHSLPAMAYWPGDDPWWWGALIGKTVMAAYTLVAAAGVAAIVLRFGNPWGAAIAASAYLACPGIQLFSSSGHNEGAVACYLILGLLAACRTLELKPEERGNAYRWWLLAGFLAGSAIACKYTSVLFVLLPILFLAAWGPGFARHGKWKGLQQPLLRISLVLLAASAACGPWLAKNWALAGNPVYPLLASQFGGTTRTPEKIAQWEKAHKVPQDEHGNRYTPALAARSAAEVLWRNAWVGPLLVPLALVSLLAWREPVVGRLWLVPLVVLAAWWLATHRVDRFLVPLFPVAAVLGGIGAATFKTPAQRMVLAAFLVFGMVAGLSGVLWQPLFGKLTWLAGQPPFASEVHRDLNFELPPDSKLLLVGDAAPFELFRPYAYNTCFDESLFNAWVLDVSADERRARLEQEGVTHIVFDWSELARYRSPGNYGYNSEVTPARVEELVEAGLLEFVRAWRPEEDAAPTAELYRVIEN